MGFLKGGENSKAVGWRSPEKWRRKEKKRKKRKIKQNYLIIIILASNLTSPEQCLKITENRKYYPET